MPTLRQYRQGSALELGPFHASTATGGSPTSLVEARHPILSSVSQDSLFRSYHVHRPDAANASDKHARVKTVASSTGTLNVSITYQVAPSNGEYFELLGLFGAEVLNTLINNVLLDGIHLVVEVVGIPTLDARRHSLAAVAPWMSDQRWVYQVGWLDTSEERDEVNPFQPARTVRGEVEQDGEVFYLSHPGQTFDPASQRLWIKLIKPAYYHCRASSASAYGSQSGLLTDVSECPVPVDWVSAGVRARAWDRFPQHLAPPDEQEARKARIEAADLFSEKVARYYEEPERTFIPDSPSFWGPWGGYRGATAMHLE